MRTLEMKQRMGLTLSDAPVTMTPQLAEQFLDSLEAGGRQSQTIRTYRRSMKELYRYLPTDKQITGETLKGWKEHLKSCGYSDSTINIRLAAANGFLRFCGREELVVAHERVLPDEGLPELTRPEYLAFLSKVRESGSEKHYFLIKVFASVDISIRELGYLTVEACREGIVHMPDEKTTEIPSCLQEELLQYADRQGVVEGPIFVTRDGNVMDRSNIANSIHRLAVRTEMEPEKCSPSALHQLYLSTQKELMERLRPVYVETYDNLLTAEQMLVGWKA